MFSIYIYIYTLYSHGINFNCLPTNPNLEETWKKSRLSNLEGGGAINLCFGAFDKDVAGVC